DCSLSRVYAGVHPPADDIPGRLIGRRVAARVWSKLESSVFGDAPGSRHGVRVTLRDSTQALFDSEAAANAWAQRLANTAQTAAGAAVANATVRLLPRQADEGAMQRTLVLLGAHADAGEQLLALLDSDDAVRDTEL